MEKIIVTTDLSANSKAGMRYAIQLAQTRGAELIFLHIHQVLRASFWSDQQYEHYINQNREVIMEEFPGFVKTIYRSLSITPPIHLKLAVHHNLDTVQGIVEYASKVRASYICISTRGAGLVRKLIGTTTSRLIRTAPVAVLCIPSSYRVRPIKKILYASDMRNYEQELKDVVRFARPMKASVEMLHLSSFYEFLIGEGMFKADLSKKMGYLIDLHYKPRDVERSLMSEIRDAVRKSKPSVLALFTHQDRSLFERLLLPGNAKEYSFHASIPLLSFPKPGTSSNETNLHSYPIEGKNPKTITYE